MRSHPNDDPGDVAAPALDALVAHAARPTPATRGAAHAALSSLLLDDGDGPEWGAAILEALDGDDGSAEVLVSSMALPDEAGPDARCDPLVARGLDAPGLESAPDHLRILGRLALAREARMLREAGRDAFQFTAFG